MGRTRTWRQREHRYRLDRATAKRVLATLAKRLPLIIYQPGATINLVVTTYLDTPDRHYLGIADVSGGHRSVKLRIREYLASAGIGAKFSYYNTCFLERKERVDEVRLKQRIELPKTEIGGILRKQHRIPEGSPEAHAITTELDALDLAPAMVSAYERQVFGFEFGLRVTFDERLAYHFPPQGLYDDALALQPSVLGRPPARGPSRILEVKCPATMEVPRWLEALLASVPPAEGFSKFRDGMHSLDESDGPVRLTSPIRIIDLLE